MGLGYQFDVDYGNVKLNGCVVYTIKGVRCKILSALLKESFGKTITKDKLIEAAWGKTDTLVFGSALTQQIYLLRKDIEAVGLPNYIQSKPKKGYYVNISAGDIDQRGTRFSKLINALLANKLVSAYSLSILVTQICTLIELTFK